jgi:hypothetical protein
LASGSEDADISGASGAELVVIDDIDDDDAADDDTPAIVAEGRLLWEKLIDLRVA